MPRGPTPKHPKIRQRRNRAATAATLIAAPASRALLPAARPDTGQPWHEATLRWWQIIWQSPMAQEWLESDVLALERLALLVDDRYRWEGKKPPLALEAEIRRQESRFGLTPLDRWRLQWEVGRAAPEKPRLPAPAPSTRDPRDVLRVQ